MTERRTISIVSPCRNERDYIAGFVASLLAQELPPGCALELLIADGQSDDGTRERLGIGAKEMPKLSDEFRDGSAKGQSGVDATRQAPPGAQPVTGAGRPGQDPRPALER